MVYSVITREADVTAVDTATPLTELGANTPGTVDVPNASFLTGIIISAVGDWTADAAYGFSSAINLSGSGIGGYQSYSGPCGGTVGAAATAAGGAGVDIPQFYKARIPVQAGQGIDINGWMHGEDMGSLRITVGLEFDGVPGICKDFDYRECDLTAANTPVVLGAKLGAAYPYMLPSSNQIGEIHVNGGFKIVAGPLAAGSFYELYGAAMPSGAVYEFPGHGYFSQDDAGATTSGGTGSTGSVSRVYTVPPGKLVLKSGNRYQIRGTMLEDDVGTIFSTVCIGYI